MVVLAAFAFTTRDRLPKGPSGPVLAEYLPLDPSEHIPVLGGQFQLVLERLVVAVGFWHQFGKLESGYSPLLRLLLLANVRLATEGFDVAV